MIIGLKSSRRAGSTFAYILEEEAQFPWQFYRLFERGGNILLGNSESMLVLFSFILDRNCAGSWLVFLFMVHPFPTWRTGRLDQVNFIGVTLQQAFIQEHAIVKE